MTFQRCIFRDQDDKFYILGHTFSHCFDYFKRELNEKIFFQLFSQKTYNFVGVWKQSHLQHLNGYSPHVASGVWVGQRWILINQNTFAEPLTEPIENSCESDKSSKLDDRSIQRNRVTY
jgi:hypothetical protein